MNSVIQSLEYKFGLKNRSSNPSTTDRRSAPTHRRGPGTDDTSGPYTDRCIYNDGSQYPFDDSSDLHKGRRTLMNGSSCSLYGRIFGQNPSADRPIGPRPKKGKKPTRLLSRLPTELRPVEGCSAYHRLSHDATFVTSTTCRPTNGRLNNIRLTTGRRKTPNPTHGYGNPTYCRSLTLRR